MIDWIDEFLEDDEDREPTLHQIAIIESLMITSSAAHLYEEIDWLTLNYREAEGIINHLKENNNPIDPRDQFKKMF